MEDKEIVRVSLPWTCSILYYLRSVLVMFRMFMVDKEIASNKHQWECISTDADLKNIRIYSIISIYYAGQILYWRKRFVWIEIYLVYHIEECAWFNQKLSLTYTCVTLTFSSMSNVTTIQTCINGVTVGQSVLQLGGHVMLSSSWQRCPALAPEI